ncbi:MAG: hypothetical protein A3E64_00575 [Candidatus Harrisonbacteria bacterium RIFCSPHIGHO2_12_FULL_48_16]|uniref:Uncharacterized protein n=2 Tax=Parcubacteria group TaxID=1794811 RepID=A0A1G2FV19_9BACT|nr:MAG: hypothetical protein A3E64_00575 [Candidatus Harrisonbacteria bacterium RIFCSPHIGHO2_12_FULL_48_16]OGZ41448.1 MAG: hypothetical protein A2W41_01495 [Candidatus Ryanbacteria bacterium RIFCSPHIGHO2_01_45_13]
MTKLNKVAVAFVVLLGVIFVGNRALGSPGAMFAITPSAFQIKLNPGSVWSSGLSIINEGLEDLTVYLSAVNLDGELKPVLEEPQTVYEHSLAGWIQLSEKTFIVPGRQSITAPFVLKIPEIAQPGKHFAAILIGPQPLFSIGQKTLSSAGFISAVFSVQIPGVTSSAGRIKEFFSDKEIYGGSGVNFSLTFENLGNVNLKPFGEVAVHASSGELINKIPISMGDYDSVLPGRTRNWKFSWEGSDKLSSLGRYRAIASLSFGSPPETTSKEIFFWIIPLAPILLILAIMILPPMLIVFAAKTIKAYVNKILERELNRPQAIPLKYQSVSKAIWKPFALVIVLAFFGFGIGGAAYFTRNSVPETATQTASLIIQKSTFPNLLREMFPFFDSGFLSSVFEDDFVVFNYSNDNGSWPVYGVKVKDSQSFLAIVGPILEMNASKFYPHSIGFSNFKDGRLGNFRTRYAVGSLVGAAFNYGVYNNELVIATSYDGFKKAVEEGVDNSIDLTEN